MSLLRDDVRLSGFNNLTKVVSFNLYDFFVARTERERLGYVAWIDEQFSAARITGILREIARIIDAEVLSVSDQDYEPHGASSLVLMSDLGHGKLKHSTNSSVAAHLTKSHLCAHTYPDWTDPKGICSFRVDIDIATCGTIVPLRALDYMFESFENDVVIIDYVVRGFTRDAEGKRVYMDHVVRSIQDFISPEILANYHCEDLVLQNENIWQTKMIRTRLDPGEYFNADLDPTAPENRAALEDVRREMVGIFYGWPG
ncbi:MAG: adenosylmethionine decarboxylase [Myxococcales bacterium]|nr:adenosylmethionine decarboxylase [Myxococcales bacterium]MCB9566869.1 adenosylmethionine decarboxylase [Myxococcales bacterium]MCB9704603.1 adenosylmethionine decarboxylase [Myxococcales bacterium]